MTATEYEQSDNDDGPDLKTQLMELETKIMQTESKIESTRDVKRMMDVNRPASTPDTYREIIAQNIREFKKELEHLKGKRDF
ncbi:hypothetical protein X975_06378, partial [Stegodyphus mimosarum]